MQAYGCKKSLLVVKSGGRMIKPLDSMCCVIILRARCLVPRRLRRPPHRPLLPASSLFAPLPPSPVPQPRLPVRLAPPPTPLSSPPRTSPLTRTHVAFAIATATACTLLYDVILMFKHKVIELITRRHTANRMRAAAPDALYTLCVVKMPRPASPQPSHYPRTPKTNQARTRLRHPRRARRAPPPPSPPPPPPPPPPRRWCPPMLRTLYGSALVPRAPPSCSAAER